MKTGLTIELPHMGFIYRGIWGLLLILLPASGIHAQKEMLKGGTNKRFYTNHYIRLEGISDEFKTFSVALASSITADTFRTSISADPTRGGFSYNFRKMVAEGEYHFLIEDFQFSVYANFDDSIRVGYENGKFFFIGGNNSGAKAYQEMREAFPSAKTAVPFSHSEHCLKLAAGAKKDLMAKMAKLQELDSYYKNESLYPLPQSYLDFEKNEAFYTAALLELLSLQVQFPKLLAMENNTLSEERMLKAQKIVLALLDDYPLQSPYPDALLSHRYWVYAQEMEYLLNSIGLVPSLMDLSTTEARQAFEQYYGSGNSQLAIYCYLLRASKDLEVYEEAYSKHQGSFDHPLLKYKSHRLHEQMMEAKLYAQIAQVLPQPVFIDERLAGKNDFMEYFEQFKGKVVYLDIWATWCGSCIRKFDDSRRLQYAMHQQGFGDNFVIVYLCAEGGKDIETRWKELVHRYQLSGFHIQLPRSASSVKNLELKAFPTYMIMTPDGVWEGAGSPRASYDRILELLSR